MTNFKTRGKFKIMGADKITPPKEGTVLADGDSPIFQYDEYWLAKGKEFADHTLQSLSGRMKSYLDFLNIIAGLSLIGGVALTTYLESSDPFLFGFFIVPTILTFLTRYLIGIEINEPIALYPDLRNPVQINKAFNKIVSVRKQQLRKAGNWVSFCVIVSVILIPFGMYYYNYQRDNKKGIEILMYKRKFEVSGLATSDTLWIELHGLKKIEEGTAVKDTSTTLIRRTPKGKRFEYMYALDTYGFDVTSVAVKTKDGEVLRGIETILKTKI